MQLQVVIKSMKFKKESAWKENNQGELCLAWVVGNVLRR